MHHTDSFADCGPIIAEQASRIATVSDYQVSIPENPPHHPGQFATFIGNSELFTMYINDVWQSQTAVQHPGQKAFGKTARRVDSADAMIAHDAAKLRIHAIVVPPVSPMERTQE